ncbi:MAG TPA: DUF6458 family protein [Actinomycetota bacterium]|nr:DUF6458 family protein [Actinomycetota bacterium]
MPGIGIGVVLIALGAILRFAVTADAEGFNIGTIGVILMIVGGVALLLSALFWSSWFGTRETRVSDGHAHGH